MQIFCGDRILWWPTDANGHATGAVVILEYWDEPTNRTECGCRKEPEAVEETP